MFFYQTNTFIDYSIKFLNSVYINDNKKSKPHYLNKNTTTKHNVIGYLKNIEKRHS